MLLRHPQVFTFFSILSRLAFHSLSLVLHSILSYILLSSTCSWEGGREVVKTRLEITYLKEIISSSFSEHFTSGSFFKTMIVSYLPFLLPFLSPSSTLLNDLLRISLCIGLEYKYPIFVRERGREKDRERERIGRRYQLPSRKVNGYDILVCAYFPFLMITIMIDTHLLYEVLRWKREERE